MDAMSINEENVFRILLAPDVHLGFAEDESTRYDDSFIVFEEILEKAVAECVDFVLFSGNLFHGLKPSAKTIKRTMTLIRQYCLGERKMNLQFLSDPTEVLPNCGINFAEANSNISLPLFSIHGRNDGPFGKDPSCPLDVLSASGLLNFFGRLTDDFTFIREVDDEDYSFNIAARDAPRPSEQTAINIKPLVFQKGFTQLAIYGLGHQNDTKLHNRFRNNKVNFHGLDKERVNVCVLHQNRVARRGEDYIPETLLPADLDLIIWGGEDGCDFKLRQRVVQPGSAVTTSLTNVNSCLKHIGILEIRGKQFEMTQRKLETVRPFMFRSIKLADDPFKHKADVPLAERAQQFLTRVVESMILGSAVQQSGNNAQPTLPLVHIIVEYNDEDQLFNLTRFGQKFVGQVANPFSLVKINSTRNTGQGTNGPVNRRLHTMGELIQSYFQSQDDQSQMRILSVGGVNEAVTAFVDSKDTDALLDCVDFQRLHAVEEVRQRGVRTGIDRIRDSRAIEHEIETLRVGRQQDGREVLSMLLDPEQRRQIRRQKEQESLHISHSDIARYTAQLVDLALVQQPMVQQAAFNHQPMVQQTAFDHQPMVQQAAFNHQPMVQQAAFDHQPMVQQPMAQQAAFNHQPMVQQAAFDHQPMVQQAAFDHQPMVQQAAFNHQPMVQHAAFDHQPMVQQPASVNQAMVQQPTMVRQPQQPIFVQQPAISRQVHQPNVVQQPILVQQPGMVQHPVVVQQPNQGQAVIQHQAIAQQPFLVEQRTFVQNRTHQSGNQDYQLTGASNANMDNSLDYYRAPGTPSSDTDSSTTSSSWVDRLDGVSQYRRSTAYHRFGVQQPDMAQYPAANQAVHDVSGVQQFLHRHTNNGVQQLAGNSVQQPVGNFVHQPAGNFVQQPAGNGVQQPAGNFVQQPDDDIVYLGYSGRSNAPRNQDQGPHRKRLKLEIKTEDSSSQSNHHQYG